MLFAASPKQPSTDEEEDAVAKPKNLYDGKLLVEAFLKQQDKLAPDTPQDIAASVLSGFEEARRRDDEQAAMKRTLGELGDRLEGVRTELGEQLEGVRAAVLALQQAAERRPQAAAAERRPQVAEAAAAARRTREEAAHTRQAAADEAARAKLEAEQALGSGAESEPPIIESSWA